LIDKQKFPLLFQRLNPAQVKGMNIQGTEAQENKTKQNWPWWWGVDLFKSVITEW